MRLLLSLFATVTIGFFSEFRNEGKFYFKNLHHFFGPGTWIHDGLNQVAPSLGDFVYRIEYSHWNDFLLGPAIVSVLFPLAIARIYKALSDQGPINLNTPTLDVSTALDEALRFARILMNVGLFWFFWQSWAEKAGYLSNPHSSDEIDLPFEFGGNRAGFLDGTRVSSGVIGRQAVRPAVREIQVHFCHRFRVVGSDRSFVHADRRPVDRGRGQCRWAFFVSGRSSLSGCPRIHTVSETHPAS